MKIIRDPDEMKEYLDEKVWHSRKKIGFVPTLGNLHAGHTKLITAIKSYDVKIVSIFVNPTQFAANEDIENYPQTEKRDLKICEEEGVDIAFLPQADDIYVGGKKSLTQVDIPSMSGLHCGISRPTHFIGVLTVVSLLFNLIRPHFAAFGKKDFQQLRMIEIMTENLHFPIRIIPVDTGRAEDGLAYSSRNKYLSAEQREQAPALYRSLQEIAEQINKGSRQYSNLEKEATKQINEAGLKTDYVHIVRQTDLMPANSKDNKIAVLAAAYLGKARLIDNITIEL